MAVRRQASKGPRCGPFAFLVGCVAFLVSMAATAAADPPLLLLAERYNDDVDVTKYWASEKFDGVRAYWDGRLLRFRSGNVVRAPAWFVDGLPRVALDGELWLGRGTFDRLSAIVRRNPPVDAEWRQVRYMVFELPDAPGAFSERIVQMQRLAEGGVPPWLSFVEQFRLADKGELREKLAEVVRQGGEGLMLHRDDAPYQTGRSPVLLKVTPWLDAEARVVGHVPGKGRHAGVLGALRVEMPSGRRFSLGSGFSDGERRQPPAIGTMVTYRYRELNASGKPRFARFLRVREEF